MLLDNETPAGAILSEGASFLHRTESETQLTLGQMISRTAGQFPNQPAIVSSSFSPLTYQGLEHQLAAFRRRLRLVGFDCNARIGIVMPNGPEAVLAIVAVACCSIAVPLDPRLSRSEIDQRLDMLCLSALVVPQDSASEARRAAEERKLVIIEAARVGHRQLGLEIAVQVSGSPAIDAEPDPRSPAFILQTSGTTAEPKLIPFSHHNMLAAAARLRAWFGLIPRDRCLSVSAPYYSHGLKVTIFTPLLTGGSVAIPANSAVVALDEWFDVLRPTWYSASPALHAAILDKAQPLGNALASHSLRFVVSGGAPLSRNVQDGLQRALGVPVLEHYGSSEAAQIAANLLPPGPNRQGTCGRPWPDTVAIVGEDGHPLAAGARGEIWVCGPTVTSGYVDAPDLNQTAFAEGWFRTGDIGSLDDDGFLSLHGRLGELINRGGEKIAPAEIEAALLRHPAITEAAAFAISHPRLGEDVAAAIVPRRGSQATGAELRAFLQRELASFKIPRRILTLDDLPKGMTGKVQRRRLRELIDRRSGSHATVSVPVENGPLDLEAEVLTLWRRLLKSEALTVDDDFFASGGDSLLAVEMLIEVERLVGRPVPETILFEAETIRQFAARVSAQTDASAMPFFQPHACGNRSPLYFFNGNLISGHPSVRRMVELFGPDYPIVSINPHGLRGEPIPNSIEAMAADRLPLILEKQTSGPFLLGGRCNGAMVAFEVARLLMAAGHKVDMVAMIDPPTVAARPIARLVLELLKPSVSPRILRGAFERMAQLERRSKVSKSAPVAVSTLKIPPLLWDIYSIAMARYCPAPLDVPVAFYAAEHDGRAWRHLTSQLEVIQVPGGHDGCLTVGAEVLIDHLRQRIDLLVRPKEERRFGNAAARHAGRTPL
ncbi:AMP-binding protein [Bradyrhizobium erythrophlei]|uniref:Acyl-CoA synthetase (AMP-forming)/AMP-acid ligase II n=1 Tax=Bradyrhizobium erythrophlei TaxID=1437360 RepID=A0A1H4YBP0_9BRAD|nr:AMP-binding protein [Bradyrhizobium erythrophlei]SED14434.1 Acyl-CoA synthetase (AMP-forming)/AMP-acid ligase II [Bradyrhizobium erythrophlei]